MTLLNILVGGLLAASISTVDAQGFSSLRLLNDPPRQPGSGAGDIRIPISRRFQWQEAFVVWFF